MKAIDDRYKAAMIDEYESYMRAKRTKDAQHVAKTLLDTYGYDVTAQEEPEKEQAAEPSVAPETTAAAPPPEAAVEPKAQAPQPKTNQPRTAAKKAAPSKPAASKNN